MSGVFGIGFFYAVLKSSLSLLHVGFTEVGSFLTLVKYAYKVLTE
ncbi:MAG: hypothetical protein ACSHWT_00210 [Glaciecola sp.]